MLKLVPSGRGGRPLGAVCLEEWSVRGLLVRVAQARPPLHALIDVGALVTGYDNEQVRAFCGRRAILSAPETAPE